MRLVRYRPRVGQDPTLHGTICAYAANVNELDVIRPDARSNRCSVRGRYTRPVADAPVTCTASPLTVSLCGSAREYAHDGHFTAASPPSDSRPKRARTQGSHTFCRRHPPVSQEETSPPSTNGITNRKEEELNSLDGTRTNGSEGQTTGEGGPGCR